LLPAHGLPDGGREVGVLAGPDLRQQLSEGRPGADAFEEAVAAEQFEQSGPLGVDHAEVAHPLQGRQRRGRRAHPGRSGLGGAGAGQGPHPLPAQAVQQVAALAGLLVGPLQLMKELGLGPRGAAPQAVFLQQRQRLVHAEAEAEDQAARHGEGQPVPALPGDGGRDVGDVAARPALNGGQLEF
jgi:hypothetical protein